jgi:hypothetical protein
MRSGPIPLGLNIIYILSAIVKQEFYFFTKIFVKIGNPLSAKQ